MKDLPCIINVGLCSNADIRLPAVDRIEAESERLALWYRSCKAAGASQIALQHSNTEPTLVATFPQHYFRQWLATLAGKTQQDAIAVYYPTIRQGELIGPKSKGLSFLREFFVLFNGTRLEDNPSL